MTVATKPLGSNTKSVSTNSLAKRREKRFELQRIAGKLLPEERVSWCYRRLTSPALEIRKSGDRAYYHGLAVCGSAWVCPVCSSRISEVRRTELRKAVGAPYSLFFVTITLQHSREDKLSSLLETLNSSWKATRGGRAWQEIERRYGVVASASSLEITYSQEAGFHPHRHILFFSSLPESELNIEALEAELSARWLAILAKRGGYGSEYYSLKVQRGTKPVSEYLAKWSSVEELVKTQSKVGRGEHYSMWQVLELAGTGEAWAVCAFKEYAVSTKGKRLLSWSKGARVLLKLGEEKTEQEIAETETDTEDKSELVCTIEKCLWYEICKREQRAQLLELAEREGSPGVEHYLERLREEASSGESYG